MTTTNDTMAPSLSVESGGSPFTGTVPEATRLFLGGCQQRGLAYGRCLHPLKGPEGESLELAWCRIGPEDAEDVLLITSGMHGIEGFAGAAIQTDALRAGYGSVLPENTAIFMIHMLNPWGAAWGRRENEDNVDLFRNFLYDEPPFFAAPDYDALDEAINPREWTGPVRTVADQALNDFISAHGMDRFVALFRRGQHSCPKGLTYHGQGPVWSKRITDDLLHEQLRDAKRILALDIHTGFGAWGEGIMVGYAGQGEARLGYAEDSFGPLYVAGGDPLIPSHRCMPFEALQGKAVAAEIVSVGLEFGTYDLEKEIGTLRHISHIFNYGDPQSAEGVGLRAQFTELLYPAAADWRNVVLTRGAEVLDQAIQALPHWPDDVSFPPPTEPEA